MQFYSECKWFPSQLIVASPPSQYYFIDFKNVVCRILQGCHVWHLVSTLQTWWCLSCMYFFPFNKLKNDSSSHIELHSRCHSRTIYTGSFSTSRLLPASQILNKKNKKWNQHNSTFTPKTAVIRKQQQATLHLYRVRQVLILPNEQLSLLHLCLSPYAAWLLETIKKSQLEL